MDGVSMKKTYFFVPIVITVVFVSVVLYYIVSPVYPGVFPIGIITGMCILAQLIMLFFSIKNLTRNSSRFKSWISIGIEVGTIIVMGYFFVVWMMVI